MTRALRAGRRATPAGLALLGTACSGSFGMPRGATEQGADIFRLWQIFFIAAIPVAGVVYGLIFWSVIRYRRRRSEDPAALGSQFRGNHRLELVYMGIPILIVIGLFAASATVEVRVDRVSADPDVLVVGGGEPLDRAHPVRRLLGLGGDRTFQRDAHAAACPARICASHSANSVA